MDIDATGVMPLEPQRMVRKEDLTAGAAAAPAVAFAVAAAKLDDITASSGECQ